MSSTLAIVRSRPSSLVTWITGVGGVLLIAYNVLDAYTTVLGFTSPRILQLFGTPMAWLLLFVCFCTLWWQLKHPDEPAVDGVVYREVIKLRQENENLRRTIDDLAPRRLTESQQALIRARLSPIIAQAGRGPQISIFWTGAGDSAGYAKQFEELLESIGFSMLRVSGPGTYLLKHDYHYGIWVRHDSRAAITRGATPFGKVLVTALKEAEVSDVIDFDYDGHQILELIVGARYRSSADAQCQQDEVYTSGRTIGTF